MATEEKLIPQTRIAPATAIGTVRLTVRQMARSRSFYEHLLGLPANEIDDSRVAFTAPGGEPLVELTAAPQASPRNPRQTGLFHLAVLYPTRRDLAVALVRLASEKWPLQGASDHLVSEALYLSDPEGNGIELYADRDRASWPLTAGGEIEMDTLPLDLDDLLHELEHSPIDTDRRDRTIAPGTRIGHVHLQVAELGDTEDFYAGVLGFDVTSRWRGQALFVSAGGYHHHIGLNTWNSRGAQAPPPDAAGLSSFEVVLPDQAALEAVLGRVSAAGIAITAPVDVPDAALVRDPSGNALLLRPAR